MRNDTPENMPDQGFTQGQRIEPGTPVFDRLGDKVGKAKEQNLEAGCLTVEKGMLFHKDVYIPFSAIRRVDDQGVWLTMEKDDLKRQNWESLPQTGAQATTTGAVRAGRQDASGATTDQDMTLPVREEELMVGKRQTESGKVRVKRDVDEEEQTASVPLTHEEVRVERVPMEGRSADLAPDKLPDAGKSGTTSQNDIVIPVRSEEPVVGKRAKVDEEIRIHKQSVTEERQVKGTVRKERVDVEGMDAQGDTPLVRSDGEGAHEERHP